MNVLVDTSIWSLALRRKARGLNTNDLNPAERAAVAELTHLIQEGRARIIGLVRQELLSGINTSSQYEKLRGVLRSFPDEPVATADYEAAAEASKECRAQGVAVSVSDILICVIAIARDWSIFAADPDFKSYARILPLHLHTPRKQLPAQPAMLRRKPIGNRISSNLIPLRTEDLKLSRLLINENRPALSEEQNRKRRATQNLL